MIQASYSLLAMLVVLSSQALASPFQQRSNLKNSAHLYNRNDNKNANKNEAVQWINESSCVRAVHLRLGQQVLSGWIGSESVTFMRRGQQFYGIFQGQPVSLQILGSQDGGYRLRGRLLGQQISWRFDGEWVFDTLTACPRSK
jgi:hypothetical protein